MVSLSGIPPSKSSDLAAQPVLDSLDSYTEMYSILHNIWSERPRAVVGAEAFMRLNKAQSAVTTRKFQGEAA